MSACTTAVSPLNTAPASGVCHRSLGRLGSAPRSSSAHGAGVAVIRGEHHETVALVIAQVGVDAGIDVRARPVH
jgi:hypothetical protein